MLFWLNLPPNNLGSHSVPTLNSVALFYQSTVFQKIASAYVRHLCVCVCVLLMVMHTSRAVKGSGQQSRCLILCFATTLQNHITKGKLVICRLLSANNIVHHENTHAHTAGYSTCLDLPCLDMTLTVRVKRLVQGPMQCPGSDWKFEPSTFHSQALNLTILTTTALIRTDTHAHQFTIFIMQAMNTSL